MIVRLLRTVHRGQEEAGRIIYEDGELRVEGTPRPEQLLNAIFLGPTPEDPKAIEAALLDMPRRWDGSRLRAQVVMGEGSAKSGWYAPPRGTHGPGSQGGKKPALSDHEYALDLLAKPVEHAVITRGGEEIFRKMGKRDHIDFTDEEANSFKDGKLIHNHPDGSQLSIGDVNFVIAHDLEEIQALGYLGNGQYRRSKMVRGEKGWPLRETAYHVISIQGAAVMTKLQARIHNGEITIEQAEDMHFSILWEQIDDDLGFDYTEEVVDFDEDS